MTSRSDFQRNYYLFSSPKRRNSYMLTPHSDSNNESGQGMFSDYSGSYSGGGVVLER